MPEDAGRGECKLEAEAAAQPREELPQVVRELVASCDREGCYHHISPIPLPNREVVTQIVDLSRRVLFPGYFDGRRIEAVNLEYHLGTELMQLFDLVSDQVTWAVRHDCFRHELVCSHCADRGHETALAFVKSLPDIRRLLALDVRAALEGDPAVGRPDEVIFSYPGLLAITVYRLAHCLIHLDVPLLPRMMSEWAHAKTGIDIHPMAEIGESFFIDHGTGVVIGQTAVLGNGVRLYQGVTLGALSLPRGQMESLRGAKRHPTIEDEVIIYSGATILGGDTVVGARSVIGGNVWLTESVPPDTKVFLKKPELVYVGPRRGAGKDEA